MAKKISAAVGTSDGKKHVPNYPKDLTTITSLFDRIPVVQGGTAKSGTTWAQDHTQLIAQVTAQIIKFQTVNRRPSIDGVVDAKGGTLRTMNEEAISGPGDTGIDATVMPAPKGFPELVNQGLWVADIASVSGKGELLPVAKGAAFVRKLVKVDDCSIKWFGVVLPNGFTGQGSTPHINFTPRPGQNTHQNYQDGGYDQFDAWIPLWADYTNVIGSQLAASGCDQILVIPFYRNEQWMGGLGDFLTNWHEVIAQVITAALDSLDPLMLRDTFTFSEIVSSSFSNGWNPHKNFFTDGVGVEKATRVLFDLDGVGAHPPSTWFPAKGVFYRNQASPVPGNNQVGSSFYVGGRWGAKFISKYPGGINTHAACRNHLLFHGLLTRCRS
jgi:hypothetical protein